MKLTKYEQETIINFNNDEQEASIYTASPQMMRKLDATGGSLSGALPGGRADRSEQDLFL